MSHTFKGSIGTDYFEEEVGMVRSGELEASTSSQPTGDRTYGGRRASFKVLNNKKELLASFEVNIDEFQRFIDVVATVARG